MSQSIGKHYSKLGGDVRYASQRLAQGLGAAGAVLILYRGMNEESELGMSFDPSFKLESAGFRKLTDAILNDSYSTALSRPDKACDMLAEATEAEGVIVFLVEKQGTVRITVSQPNLKELVAAIALRIADSLDARN